MFPELEEKEDEWDRGFTVTVSGGAGGAKLQRPFCAWEFPICHLTESRAFNSIKLWLCAPRQSTRSPYYQFMDALHQRSPSTAPVINHPPRFKKSSPETRFCYSTAASCGFNQKMQLTEPILHSPFTPLHSTPLHLLSLHPTHRHAASPGLSPGCHQNAGPVWRTTHRVIINKRRWQVNIPPEC